MLQKETVRELNLPPALDVYKSKVSVADDIVNYGLNMYFKKPHKSSDDSYYYSKKFSLNKKLSLKR